jgi:hypothetical protein
MIDCEVTVEDADRRIEFHLRVQARVWRERLPRYGWRDGGDPGEPGGVELVRVWCLGISIWCGPESIEADLRDEAVQRRLGDWCATDQEEEIVKWILQQD